MKHRPTYSTHRMPLRTLRRLLQGRPTPAPVLAAGWLGDESIKHGPLKIRQVSKVEKRHKTCSRQIVRELFKAKPCGLNHKDDAVHLQRYRASGCWTKTA